MELSPTLEHIKNTQSLKWIFVGGKGGVGKTTTSASLGVYLAQHRESVLIISTDPAHNISDAFDQKIGDEPTQIIDVPNLYAMEIKPKVNTDNLQFPDFMGTPDESSKSLIAEMINSVPGIDEAMSFGELMKNVQSMAFSVIIFDTAPTGHTLRLLQFPQIMDQGLEKLVSLKNSMGPFFTQITQLFGAQDAEQMYNGIFEKIETMKMVIEQVHMQFKDPSRTSFVAVCIPEFLSIYETERLVQELFRFEIDISSIVINQVVFPEGECNKCSARRRMQDKYLQQLRSLYDDFHLIVTPLLDEEVRGVQRLRMFGEMLFTPYSPAN